MSMAAWGAFISTSEGVDSVFLRLYGFWLDVGDNSMYPKFVKLVPSLELITWLALFSGLAEHTERTPVDSIHGWKFLKEEFDDV